MVATSLLGCGIYRILNLINGKFYIGSSIEREGRRYDHLWALRANRHHSYRLQADFNLYGESAFVFEAVENIDDPARLLEAEQWWIDDSCCYDEDIGYNISPTAGSTLGKAQSEKTKDKIRQKALGRVWSEEAVNKLKATFALPEHNERMAAWFRSEEFRSRISLTKGGSGYVLNLDDIAKAIVLYETGDISIKKIAAAFDVSYQQMRSALMAIGPKFGEERQVYDPINCGNDAASIARKIAKTLCSVSDETADEIRRIYAEGGVFQSNLAKRFGVSKVTVHRIIKAKHAYGSVESAPIETARRNPKRVNAWLDNLDILPIGEAAD